MATVRNLRGSSKDNGKNWKEWWENETGRSAKVCSHISCSDDATDGAHVHKINDNTVYITPLCHSCNMIDPDQSFTVADNSLVKRH